MKSQLNPYLNFENTTREALTFYQNVFGGELTLRTFADFGAAEDPADADKIMHGVLTTMQGMMLMASDTPTSMPARPGGSSISLAITGSDERELRGYWDKLIDGGQVAMPLAPQMWGDVFGMCVDKFGIAWMINISSDTRGAGAV